MYVEPAERATWYAWNSARLALGVIVAALMSAVSDAAGRRASVAVMSRSGATPMRSTACFTLSSSAITRRMCRASSSVWPRSSAKRPACCRMPCVRAVRNRLRSIDRA